MPTITDFLLGSTGGATGPVVGVWVRLQNNSTLATFVANAATDALGTFTVAGVPPGTYTVATGPTSLGPFTVTTDINYFIGADVGAAANTFTGAVTVQGALTGLSTLTTGSDISAGGNVFIKGSDPWFDVKNSTYAGGAVGNGVANDAPAINAAITACQSAGGGVVYIPPGTYALSSALQITANARVMILGWGALLQPAANIDALFISQANGTTALGCEIHGLVIDGQSRAGVTGIRLRDTDRGCLRNCRVVNCVTGVQIESFTASRFAEENSVEHSFIFNCTTGINVAAPGGTGSLGETHMFNVGVSSCATGIALNSPAVFYRCRLLGVTIWLPTNGTGLKIDCNVTDSVFIVDFENLMGTQTGLTGVNVTTNALGIPALDAHFGFTGAFATQVSDTTSKGMLWSDGTRRGMTTTAANGILGLTALAGDTFDRVRTGALFAGGGGLQFGNGSLVDVNIYRAAAGALETDGAFARGDQSPTFAASYTPDPTLGEVVTMTLTNNITVNAPVNGALKGVDLKFIWTQDGTGGRTITYNAIFHTSTGAALVTTASTVTIDTFTFDGSVWRLISRQTGQT